MLLWIWTRNDESGLLDDEFRDGDIFQVKPDSFEQFLGNQDVRSYLIVKVPDPPNFAKFEEQLVEPEYGPGATSGDENVVRRQRKYRLDWRSKFIASEQALIESTSDTLPDGTTSGSGTVANGVVSELFTIADLIRK
ncbi:MAG: hypothetical protein AAGG48_14565 [Planctomycetota bacterium]